MDMMHRIAILFENLGKCPEVVGSAMPQTWAFVVRFVELAASQESVVESALKIVMCAPSYGFAVLDMHALTL
jgi:hypothetical protein